VLVEIRYFHTLPYDSGTYRYVFPMVIGHRYGGVDPSTGGPRATDHEKTHPPRVVPGERSGHDIELVLEVDMGVPVRSVTCASHAVAVERPSDSRARVSLAGGATIPNRDFVLELSVAAGEPQLAMLAHRGERGGFLTLLMEPPQVARDEQVVPRELFFILDSSGSMSGVPIERSKDLVRLALSHLRPNDVFNLATFAGDARLMSDGFLARTDANLKKAWRFLDSLEGSGGTEMEKGIALALEHPRDPERVRLVVFLTDGGVSFEGDIFERIEKSRGNARVFSFGIGSSVNRHLIEGLAEHGRGTATVILHDETAERVEQKVREFYARIDAPVLVDVELDFGGLRVTDLVPARIPDLFVGKPVTVSGRFEAPGKGRVTLRALAGSRRVEHVIDVELPALEPAHVALAPVWARQRIHELSAGRARSADADARSRIEKEITGLALEFELVSAFTSFVAVDESRITAGGEPIRVLQPVEVPAGVNYETTFGPLCGGKAFRVPGLGAVVGEARGSLVILLVDGDSALARAGVEPLSTIERWRGSRVDTLGELESIVLQTPPGVAAEVVVAQGEKKIPVEVRGD
jgi:Ca-activated chloride channel family protein